MCILIFIAIIPTKKMPIFVWNKDAMFRWNINLAGGWPTLKNIRYEPVLHIHMVPMVDEQPFYISILIGGWPTALKNDGVKVRLDHHPVPTGENKIHVPNHQPDYVFCIGTIIHGYSWIHGYSKIASILLILVFDGKLILFWGCYTLW